MTIQEALDRADQMRPNTMERELKVSFLSEIEKQIHIEIIMKHEHTAEEETEPEYDGTTDPETVLLIPAPYDKLYWEYINSKIDYLNQEMDKYNNDRAMFESDYREMADWINRTRMPIRTVREILI